MDYWEFLLQKEGDRSWRPIKSQKFKIEAGRYRVVAHSSCTNTDVEICVMHECTEEDPPKRRFQKRSRRTNPEGLMVVIPFTYLKPGSWELRCCGDIMSDLLGKSWKKAVRLEVLPKASEVLQVPESVAPITDDTQTELVANSPSNHLSEKENQELRESKEITSLNGSEASQQDLAESNPVSSLAQEQEKAEGRGQKAGGIYPDADADGTSHLAEPLRSNGHNPPMNDVSVAPVHAASQSSPEQNLLPSASCPPPSLQPIPIETEVSPLTPVASALSNNQDEIMEETKDLRANQEQFTEEQLDLEMDQLMEDLTSLISEVDSVPAPQLNETKLAATTDKIIPFHPVERNNN